jgi:hypothetical protein
LHIGHGFEGIQWFYGGEFTHPNKFFREEALALEEFKRCNMKESRTGVTERPDVHSQLPLWQPPFLGVVKVNWDAAMNKKNGCIGFGIITRDSDGHFLGARCTHQKIEVNPLVAEVMATLSVVLFSKKVGFFDTIFEGDALHIVKEVNSNSPHMN